ncbi:GDSL-type esterase/lipase family protein [Actinoplanes sp. NPDC051494]|uniref:GDSL-type esterase/lipase family protein n=1 Tax=Actinoplanes sp. NPDC051494 TaxID=3363907 RepID=UPI00379D4256
MKTFAVILAMSLAGILYATPAQAAVGAPNDPNIAFHGRWDTTDPAAVVPKFAGAYFITGFTGTRVSLKQRNAIDLYYSIDGGTDVYLQNKSGTVGLTPSALPAGNHTLRVSYRVVAGSYHGDAVFQGLILDSGARTIAPARPSRLFEFIGDSITVGTTSSRNALTAYGWLTGEKLGAAHTQIAEGGACLVSAADGCTGMADRFLRTSPVAGSPLWDFTKYQADAVVINLGTNDVGHGVSTTTFQTVYTQLLRDVRARYPRAAILALQTFTKRYAAQTQAAVTATGDANTFYIATDGWIPAGGLTDNVHPNDAGHQAIAARLAPLLEAKTAAATALCPTPATTSVRAAAVTVWMAGDSTMMNPQGGVCPAGWGSQFAPYFTSDVTVQNKAVGGRSVQTWLYEGNVTGTKDAAGECVVSPNTYSSRWTATLDGMKSGDYLFIQFGINDGDSACPRHVGGARYQQLLGAMVQAAKAKGAKPVLVTPVAAITCSGSTAVGNRGFLTETRNAATATSVPVIDLHARSVALYNTLKLCPNNGDYTAGAVGAFFCNDHTHFEIAGARQIAGLITTALREQNIPLASYLR